MPWGQAVQTGPHSTTRYWEDPNARKLVEAKGSIKINGFDVTIYANEWGKYQVIAYRLIDKNDNRISVNNTLEIRLETTATIPKFVPIEKQDHKNHYETVTFCEVNDGRDLIVPEFNEYQEIEPYVRKYSRSSIIKAYDFLKQYLPEFEDLIKDPVLEKHTSKIVEKAQKL
jgi:hypothetical protein